MSRATTAIALFVGVAATATVLRLTLFAGGEPDPVLIKSALAESIEASKEGRPGSMIDLLSQDFEVNGYAPATGEVSRMIKEYKPNIEVLSPEPTVSGSQAEIVSPVRLSLKFPAGTKFDINDVKLKFEKEQTTAWLLFPSTKWRLKSVHLPEDVATQIGGLTNFGGMGGFPGFGG